jgi:hypothetical protein
MDNQHRQIGSTELCPSSQIARLKAFLTGRVNPVDSNTCKQKAKECLELADQFTDPRQKRAMMQFAEWWLRLADFPYATDLTARISED